MAEDDPDAGYRSALAIMAAVEEYDRTGTLPDQVAVDLGDGKVVYSFEGIQKQAEANAQRAIEAMNAALKKPDRDRTVGGRAEAWYRSLRSSVDAGRISVPRWGAYQRNLEVFTAWVGPNAPIDALTAAKLEEYYAHLSGFVASGRYAPAYTRSLLAAAQQFIAWNSELGLIPPPGNLRSRKFRFSKSRPQGLSRADLFTPGEFRILLAAAGERLRLFLLLMANCGMYQGDVSDLGEDEVDWQARTITRSRSKTGCRSSPTGSGPRRSSCW